MTEERKARIRMQMQAYYQKHKERIKKKHREWYERNRERVLAKDKRKWRELTPEKKAAYVEQQRARRAKDEMKYRAARAAARHGLDAEEVRDLLRRSNCCEICGSRCPQKRLVVDHCHDSGQLRGLLCGWCNTGLGSFEDDPERLRKAAEYLEAKRREDTGTPY